MQDTQPDTELRRRKVWQVLVAKATNRQTITYGDLAAAIGSPARMAQAIGRADLDPISDYCREHGLPPLWVIVVNQETGRSGQDAATDLDTDAERERVFNHPWFAATPYS